MSRAEAKTAQCPRQQQAALKVLFLATKLCQLKLS